MPYSLARILKYCCLAFVIGIALASWFYSPENSLFYLFVAAVISVVLFFLCGSARKFSLAFLFFAFFLFGVWRSGLAVTGNDYSVRRYNGQEAEIAGQVVAEPDGRENNTKLTIQVGSVNGAKAAGLVLITTENYPRYDYGDILTAKCDLTAPEEFNGFAYDRYLARYDIYCVCYYPVIELLSKGGGNKFMSLIYEVKNRIRGVINRGLGEPQAVLVNAIILGDKKGLPADLQAAFSRTGLSHIIAISGLNISILVVIIMSIFLAAGLSRQKAFYFATVFFGLYIILVGFPASALRAGVMGFLALWAIYLGRLNKFDHALVLAAAIMLLFNPKLLRDDIGFQLSFLAMLGLAYFYPLFKAGYDNWQYKWAKNMLDIINMTVAAQVLTWPVIVYNFKVFSLIAPLANLLVIWTLPWQMGFALAAIGLGLLLPAWSFIYFLPVNILTVFLIRTAELLSRVPHSFLIFENLTVFWIIIYYVLSAVAIYIFRPRLPGLILL